MANVFVLASVSALAILIADPVLSADTPPLELDAPIIKHPETGLLIASMDLGRVSAGQELKLSIALVNRTSEVLRFDSVDVSCNCTKLSPSKGAVSPDEQIKVALTILIPAIPNAISSGGIITFRNGTTAVFELRFNFSFESHVGFRSSLAIVEWDQDTKTIEFSVPVLVGNLIDSRDISVDVHDLAGELIWDLKRPEQQMELRITPHQTNLDLPRYLALTIANLRTGQTSMCRVIVEAKQPLAVFPAIVRFLEVDDGDFEAVFFSKLEPVDDDHPHSVAVSAKVGDSIVACTSSAGDLSHRHSIRIKRDQAEMLIKDVEQVQDTTITLRFEVNYKSSDKTDDAVVRSRSYSHSLSVRFHGEEPLNRVLTSDDFVGSIRAAVVAMSTLEPMNIVGEYHASDIYPTGLAGSSTVRFRLFLSAKDEFLIWACEHRNEDADDDALGSVAINGTVIRGERLARTVGGELVSESLSSFPEHYRSLAIPHPAYWGLFRFPHFGSNEAKLNRYLADAYDENTSLVAAETPTGLKYTMTTVLPTGHRDRTSWTFELPEMNPVAYRVDRWRTQDPHNVFEQEVIWEEIEGRLRPIALLGSSQITRKKADGSGFEIGRNEYDLQASWLPVERHKDTEFREFPTRIAIRQYIDEGLEIARFRRQAEQ